MAHDILMLSLEVIMELIKSKWIRFSVGAAILMVSSHGFIKAVAEAVK